MFYFDNLIILKFIWINQIKKHLKIPPISRLVEQKTLSFRLQEEDLFFQFWRDKNLSKINDISILLTVASVSNNLSWIFFSAYQCAIRHHFKHKINLITSLAVREISDTPMRAAFDSRKNILSVNGKKSWLVSTNVDMILLFVRLQKPIKLSFNNRTSFLRSVLVWLIKEKTMTRKKFENRRFLKNLNQGNLTLRNTKISAENMVSGKKIRGFGSSEQFFIMLSLGIYFVTRIKSAKLKKRFYIVIKSLIVDFNSRKSLKLVVKHHKKNLIKLIKTFEKLPERRGIINWDTDKIIFKNMLK